jgi:hypothetical protein
VPRPSQTPTKSWQSTLDSSIQAPTAAVGVPSLDLPADVVATVLQLVQESWLQVTAKRMLRKKSSETRIAGVLGREMIARKRIDPALNQRFRIEEEVGTRSRGAIKPDGRIDIKIIYSFDESEYFGLECKRVSRSQTLAKKYVSEGIVRFVTGKYSAGHKWAGMLGFVITSELSAAVTVVAGRVIKEKSACRLNSRWEPELRFGPIPNLYRTFHRTSRASFNLLHLFVALP